MGTAGLHFNRHKMLFFSGGAALFITLSVCLHLTPFFPSVSEFVASVRSLVVFDNRDDSCINLVNRVVWDVRANRNSDSYDDKRENDSVSYDMFWDWASDASVKGCEFQKLSKSDASDLLNGSWIVVAGDSQARLIVQSLLSLILDSQRMESIMGDLFRRHGDYQILIAEIGTRLDFLWAPYVVNLTSLVTQFKQNRTFPDVLVMGAGLWDMLRFTNATDFGVSLQSLRSSVVSMLPFPPHLGTDGPVMGSVSVQAPHLFWLGMPVLINGMLNTEEKREKMTDEMWHAYDRALRSSRLLRPLGGQFLLLDIESLSWNCGPRCTADGMHYDKAVYEAADHVMLNALLIESHQKLEAM